MPSPPNPPFSPPPSLPRNILTTLRTKLLKQKKATPPIPSPPQILLKRKSTPLDPIIEEDEDEWEDSNNAHSIEDLKSASSSLHPIATSAGNEKGRNGIDYYTAMSSLSRKKWLDEAGRKYTSGNSTIQAKSSPTPTLLALALLTLSLSQPLSLPSLLSKPLKPRRDSMFKIPPKDVELYIIRQRVSI